MTTGSKIAAVALAMLVALLAAVPWFLSDYGLGFMVNLMCYLVLTIAWTLFSSASRHRNPSGRPSRGARSRTGGSGRHRTTPLAQRL